MNKNLLHHLNHLFSGSVVKFFLTCGNLLLPPISRATVSTRGALKDPGVYEAEQNLLDGPFAPLPSFRHRMQKHIGGQDGQDALDAGT